MYEYSYFLVSQSIEGIDHQGSLISPPGGDNPANWILGHVITSRCNILAMLKINSPWDYQRCKPYLPESKPLSLVDEVEDFEEMKAVLDETQSMLISAIREITNELLSEIAGENSLGEELAGYAIHEAYHAGEMAILNNTDQSS